MSSCLAILAHAGAKDTINDFWPLWDELGVPIVAFMPHGESWPGDNQPDFVFNYGRSAHRGTDCFQRMVHCWDTLSRLPYDQFAVIEPDAVPLNPVMPFVFPGQLGGYMCTCEPGMWPYAALCPWTMDRATAGRLAQASVHFSRTHHEDCLDLLDRWVCKAASNAGVSCSTLPRVHGFICIAGLEEKIPPGSLDWVHGYKRKSHFRHLWPARHS